MPQQTTTKAKPTATRIMKCQNRATVLAIRWVPAFARMTKIRKEKAELSSTAKNKKLSTPLPRHQLSFPRMRGSIHPHVPEAAFGNALAATNNDESEANSNTDNEVPKTSHCACYTMGPRFREDDKNKKRKSRAKFSGKEQKTQHTAATPPTVIPVYTGIHSSTHARSHVWKHIHNNRQELKRNQQQHG
ncbi:TPA: hypothetical protein RQK56_002832 [Vibrio vulnificus]|nr:hypothetical protein [Vibrio vulnificus]